VQFFPFLFHRCRSFQWMMDRPTGPRMMMIGLTSIICYHLSSCSCPYRSTSSLHEIVMRIRCRWSGFHGCTQCAPVSGWH
jgi:hypothetical protein